MTTLEQWNAEMDKRSAELVQAGLPECAWMRNHASTDLAMLGPDGLSRWAAETEHHQATCEVCRRREQFVTDRFGPAPLPPVPGRSLVAPLAYLHGTLSRIPSTGKARFRPAVLAIIGILSALISIPPRHGVWLVLLYPLSLAGAGFVGFPVFRLLAEPKQGPIRRWLVLCIACVAAAWTFSGVYLLSGYSSVLDKSDQPLTWSEWSLLGLVMGLMFGTVAAMSGFGKEGGAPNTAMELAGCGGSPLVILLAAAAAAASRSSLLGR